MLYNTYRSIVDVCLKFGTNSRRIHTVVIIGLYNQSKGILADKTERTQKK